MKYFALGLALALASLTALANSQTVKDASSWSLLYGLGTSVDGRKKAEGIEASGSAFKGIWAQRRQFFEGGLMVRYMGPKDNFTYEDVKGEFKHSDLTLGAQIGFWAFSRLKLNAGYAYHHLTESAKGEFTADQKKEIKEEYRLIDGVIYGLYGGADLVLVQNKNFQFFLNYDYYHLNTSNANQWEAMAGMRFYTDASDVGKGNFFIKFFRELFMSNEK